MSPQPQRQIRKSLFGENSVFLKSVSKFKLGVKNAADKKKKFYSESVFGNSVQSLEEGEGEGSAEIGDLLQVQKHTFSLRFDKGGEKKHNYKYRHLHKRSASLGQKIKAVPKEALNSENRINRLKMMCTTLKFDSNLETIPPPKNNQFFDVKQPPLLMHNINYVNFNKLHKSRRKPILRQNKNNKIEKQENEKNENYQKIALDSSLFLGRVKNANRMRLILSNRGKFSNDNTMKIRGRKKMPNSARTSWLIYH